MIATSCGTRTVICIRNGQKPERCGSTLMTVTNRPSNQVLFLCYCKADDVCVQFCTFGCDVCICSGATSLYPLDLLNPHSWTRALEVLHYISTTHTKSTFMNVLLPALHSCQATDEPPCLVDDEPPRAVESPCREPGFKVDQYSRVGCMILLSIISQRCQCRCT